MLPPKFFLYIPSRHAKTDLFSGLILCYSEPLPNGNFKLTVAPPDKKATYTVPAKLSVGVPNWFGQGNIEVGGQPRYTIFYERSVGYFNQTILTATDWSGDPVPILEAKNYIQLIGTGVKRNVKILPVLEAPSPSSVPVSAAPSPPPPPHPPVPVIQHVAPPPPITQKTKSGIGKKKTVILQKKSVAGDLSAHVARQLLELARLKKEQCPITAEEFIEGHTAVMPCGHLFMDMAIEETFKRENDKCPACRQYGHPTYV